MSPDSPELLIEKLRELSRTKRLEGHEHAALRQAAAELERLQPSNLHTRSGWRAIYSPQGLPNLEYAAPVSSSKKEAREWGELANTSSATYPNDIHHLEHRTVVESTWKPARS